MGEAEALRLVGQLCWLEPVGGVDSGVSAWLDELRAEAPELGASIGSETSSPFGEAMLIREATQGVPVGLIDNHQLPGYEGVATINVFVDRSRARPGVGIEAFALYTFFTFAAGAEIVHVEVLEFNRAVLGILRKIGLKPGARYRQHVYVAGRPWDVLVFSWTLDEWLVASARYQRFLPGGDQRARVLG
jgi:RimJ/RimL family protein N-acetyltransferase